MLSQVQNKINPYTLCWKISYQIIKEDNYFPTKLDYGEIDVL